MGRSQRDEFTQCWTLNANRVHAYAVRHVGFDGAQEVVAETFLHAWRRWHHVPDPTLPWLLGTARKVIGNRRRSLKRQEALATRLEMLEAATKGSDAAETVATHREAALNALAALSPGEREALLLVAWDGLTPDEAATVLGVRPGTFRVRLHRARAHLSNAFDASADARHAHHPRWSHGPLLLRTQRCRWTVLDGYPRSAVGR